MKKLVFVYKIISGSLWLLAAILFFLAHYMPEKKIFSDIAYPLLGINSINLLFYSVTRWFCNKRNKEKGVLNQKTKQDNSDEEILRETEDTNE